MKLKPDRSASRRRCRPFLILPALCPSPDRRDPDMVKNPGLKLFTKTWPARRGAAAAEPLDDDDPRRPLTATLEKPTVLDIRFVGKVDMSAVRKEFLNISNLCRVPLVVRRARPGRPKQACRPLSLPATATAGAAAAVAAGKRKKKRAETSGEESWEDEESTRSSGRRSVSKPIPAAAASGNNNNNRLNGNAPNNKLSTALNGKLSTALGSKLNTALNNRLNNAISGKPNNVAAAAAKPNGKAAGSDANNNNTRRRAPAAGIATATPSPSTKLPEPCTTCGRPDLPERFHSHPPARPNARKNPPREQREAAVPKVPVKSTVQKPVAIRYKSKQEKRPPAVAAVARKPSLPSQVLVHTPPAPAPSDQPPEPPAAAMSRVRSAKRTLTCYICGREFGTASLPLHEPKCLEKFQRENASLPLHLRRKLPPKPDGTVSQEEWNKLAWESSQSSLTPCTNCGRTFYPDRLVVHQRSCKAPLQNQHRAAQQQQQPSPAMAQRGPPPPPRSPAAAHQPPSVDCYVCGRPFGTHSIGIHERQCLRKWHQENDALPPDMRATPPVRRDGQTKANTPESADEKPQQRSSSNDGAGGAAREASGGSGGGGKRPPLFPCYLCGKLFSVHSIYLHEPQCLKRWQVENDRLPPSKRRPVPLKPDIKFTRDGGIDFEATNELNWQSHLSQLVPCKLCSRTFNPDRVAVHEKSCKGN